MSAIIHASRSRYEAFNRCMRFGFILYHWAGRGIVRKGKNIYLSTGIMTHRGLEQIARWCVKNRDKPLPEFMLDHIIQKNKQEYLDMVFPQLHGSNTRVGGFDLKENGLVEDWQGYKEERRFTDEEQAVMQQETLNEQCALVEAMLRVFAKRVLPVWQQDYNIVTVEKDMAFPLINGQGFEVVHSATVDLVLQHKTTKDLFVVSYKSASVYTELNAKNSSHDTQGLSETWAFEEFLRTRGTPRKVEGVMMLHLIKGQRRETKRGSGVYEQKSPLTRGYRKIGFEGVEYAHSLYYPKPENDSGIGRLGKGWDSFDVYQGPHEQEVGGVKGWIGKLDEIDPEYSQPIIQPECGDILGEQLVTPLPYGRPEWQVESWLRQTKAREFDIGNKLFNLDGYIERSQHLSVYLDENFPQNNASCHGVYGADCQYLSVCWGTEEERFRPMEGGFEFRTPHHKAELIQIEGVK